MRIKALLLTAAFAAGGLATANAQVYSANAVGYVNLTLQPGFNIICNPLDLSNGSTNDFNQVVPTATVGSRLYKFDPSIMNYLPVSTYTGPASRWVPNRLFAPGEGAFMQLAGAGALTITFVGEVMQGMVSNPLAGGNNFNMVGSQIPQALPLGSAGQANTLEFPAVTGDRVYIFNNPGGGVTPGYLPVITRAGASWIGAGVPAIGPTIPVGTGFFVQKAGAAVQNWTRTFSVN
jgi:hypothetical protein